MNFYDVMMGFISVTLCVIWYNAGHKDGKIEGLYTAYKQFGKIPADWSLEDFKKAYNDKSPK